MWLEKGDYIQPFPLCRLKQIAIVFPVHFMYILNEKFSAKICRNEFYSTAPLKAWLKGV